jgi:hypothetical protein
MRRRALIAVCLCLLWAECQAQIATESAGAKTEDQTGLSVGKPQLLFHATLTPEPVLVSRIEGLLASYFNKPTDLKGLAYTLVATSAVVSSPSYGQILYNPAHMIFLHLPGDWQSGTPIRIAMLDRLRDLFKKDRPASPVFSAYTEGFLEFALLAGLMTDGSARETLEVLWNDRPRSEDDRELMLYLLTRPIEQAAEVKQQSAGCKQAINRFVDEVRSGKHIMGRAIPSLASTVKPTRFLRVGKRIVLVLSDTLIARYNVIARFNVTARNCEVAWATPVFGM